MRSFKAFAIVSITGMLTAAVPAMAASLDSSSADALSARFTADGFNLLLAGHTHGGQVCLPVNRALVTNCGIDRARVSGLHRHPATGSLDRPWLHVSAGLGTSPYAPVRFCCRPEATLLTLVPGIS